MEAELFLRTHKSC